MTWIKRQIRARMEKTGESYTTARMHLLGKPESETPAMPGEVRLQIDMLTDKDPVEEGLAVLLRAREVDRQVLNHFNVTCSEHKTVWNITQTSIPSRFRARVRNLCCDGAGRSLRDAVRNATKALEPLGVRLAVAWQGMPVTNALNHLYLKLFKTVSADMGGLMRQMVADVLAAEPSFLPLERVVSATSELEGVEGLVLIEDAGWVTTRDEQSGMEIAQQLTMTAAGELLVLRMEREWGVTNRREVSFDPMSAEDVVSLYDARRWPTAPARHIEDKVHHFARLYNVDVVNLFCFDRSREIDGFRATAA